jgi:hypothetical protein
VHGLYRTYMVCASKMIFADSVSHVDHVES